MRKARDSNRARNERLAANPRVLVCGICGIAVQAPARAQKYCTECGDTKKSVRRREAKARYRNKPSSMDAAKDYIKLHRMNQDVKKRMAAATRAWAKTQKGRDYVAKYSVSESRKESARNHNRRVKGALRIAEIRTSLMELTNGQ